VKAGFNSKFKIQSSKLRAQSPKLKAERVMG